MDRRDESHELRCNDTAFGVLAQLAGERPPYAAPAA
jgi:hypothetical protein